jgi:sugar lactone lactonase YvrE
VVQEKRRSRILTLTASIFMEVVHPDHQCLLGEGPLWDANRKTICWIDIPNGEIHEYSTVGGSFRSLSVSQMIGSIAICKNGDFIAALKNGFGRIDRNTGELKMIADPETSIPGNRFNDGKCDPAGRFWAGTMAHSEEPGKGSLYTLNKDLTVSKKMENISISNGMAWSADHKTMYYIDTPTYTVTALDFDRSSGEISNRRIVVRVPRENGSPDGMTIDSMGMLWIAHWDGWQVSRWNPATGKKMETFHLPVARITSCVFGGEELQDLYISTARIGIPEDQLIKQPLAGSLFVLRNIGYRGLPSFEFEG